MSAPVLIFDIETVADCDGFRLLRDLPADVAQEEVLKIMQSERLAESGSTFFRHHLHKIVAISLLFADDKRIKLWTLGREGEEEKRILTRFFDGMEKMRPVLVSWNGGGFDLPVLHYRALIHGVNAKRYFEIGEEESDYRFNNYLSRYHWRHLDLMDILSGYQAQTRAPLDEIAKLCGFPGKLKTDGAQVQALWQAGKAEAICDYCETDVLNTYGVYLRFERLRGRLDDGAYQEKITHLRHYLQKEAQNHAHLQEFLSAWEMAGV